MPSDAPFIKSRYIPKTAIFQGFSRVMTRPAGRVKRVSKSRGSGRVGSGLEVFKISRVGSGHNP